MATNSLREHLKMTLSMAWIKKLSDCEELWFISDSRLSGGRSMDSCPKIFKLTRGDCAIAFSGETDFAYPFMIQCSAAIDSYRPARTRAMDISILQTHIVKIINEILTTLNDVAPGLEIPEVEFILGGYSWIKKEFKIFKISYNKSLRKFKSILSRGDVFGISHLAIIGDVRSDAITRIKKPIVDALKSGNNAILDEMRESGFSMEPFVVLRDLLISSHCPRTIGGAPQVVKVYQHMNCEYIGVTWPPSGSYKTYVMGRPLLGYERNDTWVIDPITFISRGPTR